MNADRLDHLGLTVSDLDRSLAFWVGALGCAERGRGVVEWPHLDRLVGMESTRIEWVELELPGGGVVELQQYHRPVGTPVPSGRECDPGRSHLALRVRDLDRLIGELRRSGVRLGAPDATLLERGAYAGWRAVYAYDPDGWGLELMEPPASLDAAGAPGGGG